MKRIRFPWLRIVAAASVFVISTPAVKSAQDLSVSPNGRFLQQANGQPFFYLADTAWAMFKELSTSDIDLYLQDRHDKKFTVIQTVAVWWLTDAFTGGNLKKPIASYWNKVDYAINKAQALGLQVALLPTWPGYSVQYGQITASNAEAFGKFIGDRYRNKPVIWIIGGDVVGTSYPDVWTNMAKGLAVGVSHHEDYSSLLMSFHPGYPYSSSAWFHNAPWLDFNMIQTGHVSSNCSEDEIGYDYGLTPARPTLISEASYENIPDGLLVGNPKLNAYDVRVPAYTALFAGAAGHAYGANEVYMFWDPGDNDWGAQIWGADTPWQTALNFPGAQQMQYLRNLMESRAFGTHVPDQSIIVSGAEPCRVATRGSDNSYAFIYFPDNAAAQIDLSKVTGTGINAWWFNPRTGIATSIGQYSPQVLSFTPPTAEDWVLALDDAARGYTAPGFLN